ncbi:MAG: glycosyltransferase family 9 protein, partial [Ignavibacteria bacterium]|nr:glycosyltransferase family 9 protein [Ignavibacteria bacterium]
EAKKWEASNYVELIKSLGANFRIFMIGGKEDSANADFISKNFERYVFSVTGLLTMSESAELIRRADLFIGADSGPLYLAEAVGTPTLSLFGPTNPLFSAPRGAKHEYMYESLFCSAPVDKQNCKLLAGLNCRTLDCMKMLKPSVVANRALEMMSKERNSSVQHA